MKNNLPKEGWYVKNDGSQRFDDTVLKYLNSVCKELREIWQFSMFSSGTTFYGIPEGSTVPFYGSKDSTFGSKAKCLTIDKFIELIKPIEEEIYNGMRVDNSIVGIDSNIASHIAPQTDLERRVNEMYDYFSKHIKNK